MKVGGSADLGGIQALFKVLEAGQQQSVDLARKLVGISAEGRLMQNETEMKGQVIDLLV